MNRQLKIFTGHGNPALADAICEYLKIRLGKWNVTRFADGEIYCQILDNVRGADVFVVQPTVPPNASARFLKGASFFTMRFVL